MGRSDRLAEELRRACADIRGLVGDDARPMVVFDRGGWSPALFAELDAAGFDILTYRKNPPRAEPASAFTDHTTWLTTEVSNNTWRLADRNVRLGYGPKTPRRYFVCRQITRLCDTGHQTTIVTTGRDHDAGPLAQAIFNRWRQENFFRYMRGRFALDALDHRAVVPDDPTRTVPNPVKKDTARQIRDSRTSSPPARRPWAATPTTPRWPTAAPSWPPPSIRSAANSPTCRPPVGTSPHASPSDSYGRTRPDSTGNTSDWSTRSGWPPTTSSRPWLGCSRPTTPGPTTTPAACSTKPSPPPPTSRSSTAGCT